MEHSYGRIIHTQGSYPSSQASSSASVIGNPSWVKQTMGPQYPESNPSLSHVSKLNGFYLPVRESDLNVTLTE